MKKFLLIMLAALSATQLLSCTQIPIDGDPSVSADDSVYSETVSGNGSQTESKDEPEHNSAVSSDDVTTDNSSADDATFEIIDDSSSVSSVDDFEYAIDISPYLQYITSENLLLVNKQNPVGASYVTPGMVDVTYMRTDRAKGKMDETAEKALCAFLKEAAYYGYDDITVTSAYRSYADQEWWHNYYIQNEIKSGKTEEQAKVAVLRYSAPPGTSEHQTGLGIDMHNLSAANQSFGNTEAGKWLAANAHRFGFILRYAKDKEAITGYMYEPWHFRFVGREHATKIYEEGLCLEEYLAKYYSDAEEIHG